MRYGFAQLLECGCS